MQCCEEVVKADNPVAELILGLLGIVLGDITGLIGLQCSPLSVIGVGSGSACSANAVCCENNNTVSNPKYGYYAV